MATDPYGFPETSPGGGGSPGDAVMALWLAMASLMVCAVAPCMCYAPTLVAVPMSGAAVFLSFRARQSSAAAGQDMSAISTAGMLGGVFGLMLSLMFSALFLFYVLYMFVIVGLAASGSM